MHNFYVHQLLHITLVTTFWKHEELVSNKEFRNYHGTCPPCGSLLALVVNFLWNISPSLLYFYVLFLETFKAISVSCFFFFVIWKTFTANLGQNLYTICAKCCVKRCTNVALNVMKNCNTFFLQMSVAFLGFLRHLIVSLSFCKISLCTDSFQV